VQLVARTSPVPAASLARDRAAGPAQSEAQGKPGTARDLQYVYFHEDDKSTTMSGSTKDIERARQFRKSGERMLWFRDGGKEYVVRDAALLGQVEKIWRPVSELGAQEGKLGAKEGELGAKQGDLGRKQGEIGAQQGAIGARQGSLGARQGVIAGREVGQELTAAQRADIEQERQKIDQEMRELDAQMKQLDAKMKEIDQPMRELGNQMKVLGSEMEVLGRKMQEASDKAEVEMQALLDRAVSSGLAQLVK
jgi:hypothetical protein